MSEEESRTPPTTTAEFAAIARRFMSEPQAAYWLSLLRPSIRLLHADPGDDVVGFIAGDPLGEPGEPWPTASHGEPLTHAMSLDLAALPKIGLGLPTSGLLQFFYFAAEQSDGLVRYRPSTVGLRAQAEPADFRFAAIPLTATIETTAPHGYDHPYVAWLRNATDDEDPPIYTDAWAAAVGEAIPARYHLLGGYGIDVQYSADFAPSATPVPVRDGATGDLDPETALPVLLAQIDTDLDAGIGWGDSGISHWTLSRADLAARRFDRIELSWSCY